MTTTNAETPATAATPSIDPTAIPATAPVDRPLSFVDGFAVTVSIDTIVRTTVVVLVTVTVSSIVGCMPMSLSPPLPSLSVAFTSALLTSAAKKARTVSGVLKI